MLFADKNALRTQLKVNMLRIREREMQYYTQNCLSISTSAALLAGFAWYGLTEVPFDLQANVVVQTLWNVAAFREAFRVDFMRGAPRQDVAPSPAASRRLLGAGDRCSSAVDSPAAGGTELN